MNKQQFKIYMKQQLMEIKAYIRENARHQPIDQMVVNKLASEWIHKYAGEFRCKWDNGCN